MDENKVLLTEDEVKREEAILIDLENLLEKYGVARDDLADDWVLDRTGEILQATLATATASDRQPGVGVTQVMECRS